LKCCFCGDSAKDVLNRSLGPNTKTDIDLLYISGKTVICPKCYVSQLTPLSYEGQPIAKYVADTKIIDVMENIDYRTTLIDLDQETTFRGIEKAMMRGGSAVKMGATNGRKAKKVVSSY
jgi:hypothetical protein